MITETIRRTTCRACGAGPLPTVLNLGTQYVSDFLPGDKAAAGPKVPVELVLCPGCGLVQQRYTAPADYMYRRHYWYRSGTTQTMRDHLRDLVVAIMDRVGVQDKDVWLDVGANDGTLLSYIPGWVRRVGVEPAANLAGECKKHCDVLVQDFWSAEVYGLASAVKAKVVTAIGMLYDLEDPVTFLADVAKALHPDGVFVAQLMCLKQTLLKYDVGNLCHEHLEFYSLQSLRAVYAAAGLEVFMVEENSANGGSYRVWARLAGSRAGYEDNCHPSVPFFLRQELDMRLEHPATYEGWYMRLLQAKGQLTRFLREANGAGKRVWAYGASTKGNVLLQWWGLTREDVRLVVDRDPAKHGLCTVGSGIPIYHEDRVPDEEPLPDYMLVLPYSFIDEFVAREEHRPWRRQGGRFLVPLPEFRVL